VDDGGMIIDWGKTAVRVDRAVGRVLWARGFTVDPTAAALPLVDHDLWYVWGGHGSITMPDGEDVELRPGVCLWLRPGWHFPATQDPDDPVGHDWIHFDLLDMPKGNVRPFFKPLPPIVLAPHDPRAAGAMAARIVDLCRMGKRLGGEKQQECDSIASQLLKGLLMDLDAGSATLSSEVSHGTEVRHRHAITAAQLELTRDPARAPTVSEIAAKLGYSPDHFCRIFKRSLGRTPKEFALEARLDRAMELLDASELTALAISRLLGYRQYTFFCQQFKRKTGMTPTQYRRRKRKK
jgi:AraC-like DNA-binding protein